MRGFFWKTNIAGWSDRKKRQQKSCQKVIKGLDLKVKNMIPSEGAEPHPKDSTSLPISAYWFIATQDKWIGRCMKVCAVQTTVRRAFFFSSQRELFQQVNRTIMKKAAESSLWAVSNPVHFSVDEPTFFLLILLRLWGFKACWMLMFKTKWQQDLFFLLKEQISIFHT